MFNHLAICFVSLLAVSPGSAREGPRREEQERGFPVPKCPCENPRVGASLISQFRLQPICTWALNDLVKTVTVTTTQYNGVTTSTTYIGTTTTSPLTTTTSTLSSLTTVTATSQATTTESKTATTTIFSGAAPTQLQIINVDIVGEVPCGGNSARKRGVPGYGFPSNWFVCALTQVRDACEAALGRSVGQATYTTTRTVQGGASTTTLSTVSTATAQVNTISTVTTTTSTVQEQTTTTQTLTSFVSYVDSRVDANGSTSTVLSTTVDRALPTVTSTITYTHYGSNSLSYAATTQAPHCFTVATVGIYQFTAAAAGGGTGMGGAGAQYPGGTVSVATIFQTLSPATTYTAIVGFQGGNAAINNVAGGGGGGTYLYTGNSALFALGGAGGGGSDSSSNPQNGDAYFNVLASSPKNGGSAGVGTSAGGGGAGFGGAGGDASNGGHGGQSAAGSWAGGAGTTGQTSGGYGGGGGGGNGGGGGGAGYSGGNGGLTGVLSAGKPGSNWVDLGSALGFGLGTGGVAGGGFFQVNAL